MIATAVPRIETLDRRAAASELCSRIALAQSPANRGRDPGLAALSRRVVEATAEEHGDAWLGRITLPCGAPTPPLWRREDDEGASDFVLPANDPRLALLLVERRRAEFTGAHADLARLNAIFRRIREVDGVLLFWT